MVNKRLTGRAVASLLIMIERFYEEYDGREVSQKEIQEYLVKLGTRTPTATTCRRGGHSSGTSSRFMAGRGVQVPQSCVIAQGDHQQAGAGGILRYDQQHEGQGHIPDLRIVGAGEAGAARPGDGRDQPVEEDADPGD